MVIPALLMAMALGGCSEASAQSSPCKTIADDKERLACYDKAANANQNAVEQNTAPVEKTPDARDAYANQLRRWFLSNGMSMMVTNFEKPEKSFRHQHLFPRLLVCCGAPFGEPMIFQLAGKGQVLKNANMLGFKAVEFHSNVTRIYDVSNGVPTCDVDHLLCL